MLQARNIFRISRNVLAQSKSLSAKPTYALNHVKNMLDENVKYEIDQLVSGEKQIENTDRVYKPSHTIEFNRVGEVLLYSCDPLQHTTVYFKYPYILYESFAPILLFQWFYNPLDLSWYWNNMSLAALYMTWVPRMWYWRSLTYKVRKVSLLRGGKVVKIETNNMANDWFTSWVENYQIEPLTEDQQHFDNKDTADFLEEKGQLKYELAVQVEHFQEMGTTTQDVVLELMKEGVVHEPELFEAAMKGYNIDTSDFVINTANNFRSREGHYNQ